MIARIYSPAIILRCAVPPIRCDSKVSVLSVVRFSLVVVTLLSTLLAAMLETILGRSITAGHAGILLALTLLCSLASCWLWCTL
ncbi:hypothetical protein BGZ57DRAFT_889279 [Hyaloscypha finlandica]|nr:hypothetical protein BGZ57DRAFT_889279 [Hyaloscypha finlandica]